MNGMIRALYKDLMRFISHPYIRGLDGYHQIVIAQILDYLKVLQGGFSDTLSCHSMILFYEMLFKRTGVYAYSDGYSVFLRAVHHFSYPVDGADVSGVDPYLVGTVFNGFYRHPVIKMYIRDQRYIVTGP